MWDEELGYIDFNEEEFLAWIREFDSDSFSDLFIEERFGIESGPHGE